jgi:hypothetical protein
LRQNVCVDLVGLDPDFTWFKWWTLGITDTALASLKSMGLTILQAVEADLNGADAASIQLFELHVNKSAHLAAECLPPDTTPPCEACGRRGLKVPDRIVLEHSSVPTDTDLFGSTEATTAIYASERLVDAVRSLGLEGAVISEVGIS